MPGLSPFASVFYKEMKVSVVQLCPTLCDLTDCSPPGSSVHGILQARILKWVAIPFSRGSSQPRGWTWISCIAGRFFTIWATKTFLYKWTRQRLHVTRGSNPSQSRMCAAVLCDGAGRQADGWRSHPREDLSVRGCKEVVWTARHPLPRPVVLDQLWKGSP